VSIRADDMRPRWLYLFIAGRLLTPGISWDPEQRAQQHRNAGHERGFLAFKALCPDGPAAKAAERRVAELIDAAKLHSHQYGEWYYSIPRPQAFKIVQIMYKVAEEFMLTEVWAMGGSTMRPRRHGKPPKLRLQEQA